MRCAWSVVGIFFTMENIEEIWKPVLNYQGIYEVSNLGRIKSLSRIILRKNKYPALLSEKILKYGIDRYGYYIICLHKNQKQKTRTVHQLVAEAFLNHKPSGRKYVVNHKNFVRTDNRVENLEIITSRENTNKKHLKSSSEYTGVSWHKKNKKWVSSIFINGKLKNLGYFENEIEASKAYQEKLLTIKTN